MTRGSEARIECEDLRHRRKAIEVQCLELEAVLLTSLKALDQELVELWAVGTVHDQDVVFASTSIESHPEIIT